MEKNNDVVRTGGSHHGDARGYPCLVHGPFQSLVTSPHHPCQETFLVCGLLLCAGQVALPCQPGVSLVQLPPFLEVMN